MEHSPSRVRRRLVKIILNKNNRHPREGGDSIFFSLTLLPIKNVFQQTAKAFARDAWEISLDKHPEFAYRQTTEYCAIPNPQMVRTSDPKRPFEPLFLLKNERIYYVDQRFMLLGLGRRSRYDRQRRRPNRHNRP
jgi:hypothetical protein